MLLSSHLLAEVAQVADDVVVIVDGRIAGGGSVAALTDASEGGLESFYLDLVSGGVDDDTKAVR
ncbi:hypothetical protein GCM10025867_11110 [Frondihabitans sucicola]|uniref:ABC transporter ATP-binding protein n=1 Tax=Frondihabitans sucicola TaxID=1268041 RepID=A0ABN6XYY8_9MICO|nr:hypothetical protein GCM10025867_11110 [Frondihabitans sucicola]